MTFTTKTIISAVTALGLVASTAAALAAPANATTALNIRSGPGTGYGVVDTLFKGEAVEVKECVSNGWCYIDHNGPDGWVSSKYLAANTGPSAPKPKDDPDINFGFGFDSSGNFSFGVGVGGAPVLPPPTPPAVEPTKVCFYKNANFGGASFCVSPGSADNKLPNNWNNKISSIELTGGASVKVCRNTNYLGGCKTYGSSKANLPGPYNNKITSFKAF